MTSESYTVAAVARDTGDQDLRKYFLLVPLIHL